MRRETGITLVALVVTIIVLLILAGVTITALLGDSGIIKKAQEAVNIMNEAIQSEQDEMNTLLEELNNVMGGAGEDIEDGLSAEDIATAVVSAPKAYYGKTVSGYTCTNNSAVANWQIFYAGNEFSSDSSYHVYLIADNYIPYSSIPQTVGNNSLTHSSNLDRAAYWNTTTLNDYEGSASITNADIKKLNNDYFNQNYTSTNNNMKAVAYMLDTDAWGVYAGDNAQYAVGGPSIEILMKSYSQAHGVDYRAQASNTTGYKISDDGGSSWEEYIMGMLSTSDGLYTINTATNALGYRVASPGSTGTDNVMYVDENGNVSHETYISDRLAVFTP